MATMSPGHVGDQLALHLLVHRGEQCGFVLDLVMRRATRHACGRHDRSRRYRAETLVGEQLSGTVDQPRPGRRRPLACVRRTGEASPPLTFIQVARNFHTECLQVAHRDNRGHAAGDAGASDHRLPRVGPRRLPSPAGPVRPRDSGGPPAVAKSRRAVSGQGLSLHSAGLAARLPSDTGQRRSRPLAAWGCDDDSRLRRRARPFRRDAGGQ